MVQPASTRNGRIHCTNCLEDPSQTADVHAEEIKDDGDERVYSVECRNCGATGEYMVELGFSPVEELDEPFTTEW